MFHRVSQLSLKRRQLAGFRKGRFFAAAPGTIPNPIVLPPLPYDSRALEPHISKETVTTH